MYVRKAGTEQEQKEKRPLQCSIRRLKKVVVEKQNRPALGTKRKKQDVSYFFVSSAFLGASFSSSFLGCCSSLDSSFDQAVNTFEKMEKAMYVGLPSTSHRAHTDTAPAPRKTCRSFPLWATSSRVHPPLWVSHTLRTAARRFNTLAPAKTRPALQMNPTRKSP